MAVICVNGGVVQYPTKLLERDMSHGIDLSLFPEDRDLYSLSQMTAINLGIREEQVTTLMMHDTKFWIKQQPELGVQMLLGGKQIHWPRSNDVMTAIYAIRNADKYGDIEKVKWALMDCPVPRQSLAAKMMKLSKLRNLVERRPDLHVVWGPEIARLKAEINSLRAV